jgi:hypothetical protein
MKASWRGRAGLRLGPAFILALLFGGPVTPSALNLNKPGDASGFDEPSLKLLVEEGRRQLDRQSETYKYATDRAQTLLTVGLVVLGFTAASLNTVTGANDWREAVGLALWTVALALAVLGVAGAASVIVVRGDFEAIDTTHLSTWSSPILARLAEDYAKAVVLGETTVAARITMFRQSTRLVSWAAVVTAVAFLVTA